MDLTCQECGAKNPIKALFCRECGAKLDIESVKPKVVNKSTYGGFKFTRLAVRRLISLAMTIVIFGLLSLFLVDDAPALPDISNSRKQIAAVKYFYEQITAEKPERKTFTFMSSEAVSHYFTGKFAEQETQSGSFAITFKEVLFEFYDQNNIKISLRTEADILGLKKNLSMELVVTFENEDDDVVFNVEKVKHGMLPLPVLKDKLVYERFRKIIPEENDLNTMLNKIRQMQINKDGRLAIMLK